MPRWALRSSFLSSASSTARPSRQSPAKAAATKVVATVIEQFKGEKVLVFKFKKRKNYKKLRGHRQQLTRVEIKSVGTAVAE